VATVSDPIGTLRAAVATASAELQPGAALTPTLERPPKPELGDYSTNAALLLAPLLEEQPRVVAERLGEQLGAALGESLERVEVAGPGFLNLFLAEDWYRDAVGRINEAGAGFGGGVAAQRAERILVEFVSANPTGPVTVASGRHAAYGDSLARILTFAGHRVGREYYVNDSGRQVRLFGESIAARIEGSEVPEDGYEGDYVNDLARRLHGEGLEGADVDRLTERGVELMGEEIEASLARFRVHFDRFSSERELHEGGAHERAMAALKAAGVTYESEGAVWMRTTDLGDDKDRVLVRADGEPTYFSTDITYHRDKLERGWERLVDVLGADHHGYVPRLRAAVAASAADPDALEVPIMQLVQILEGGERASMSKRRGEFVTLDTLLDDIGVDAARFFLVQRSHETPIDIDLELARTRSNENPVYYVQYAHARICQIFRRAEGAGAPEAASERAELVVEPGLQPAEKALISRLLELPAQVERAEQRREPHSLGAYARELAADFHAFYRDCPVVKAPEPLRAQRLALCGAARTTIATVLGLLGIEAPEEM
jgi:arginyl-tRNA synthetase